jgi:hypothetical protein
VIARDGLPRPHDSGDTFRHLAVIYRSLEELLEVVTPLLSDALVRDDVLWATVTDLLRVTIEKRQPALAPSIVFREPTQLSGYSGQTIAVQRANDACEIVKTGRGATILSDGAVLSGHPAAHTARPHGSNPRASTAWSWRSANWSATASSTAPGTARCRGGRARAEPSRRSTTPGTWAR